MGKIYLLEQRKFYYIDVNDNENVEDNFIIGYFTADKIIKAKNYCIDKGISEKELFVEEYDFQFKKNRKYVYILMYEYSRVCSNDRFEDYYYKFQPMHSRKECLVLKKQLLNEEKYQKTLNKIYDSKDGFFIDKIEINFMSHVDYCLID